MRVIFAIPHFFHSEHYTPQRGYGTLGSITSEREKRLAALRLVILNIWHLFSGRQGLWDINNGKVASANETTRLELKFVICTTHTYHLLGELDLEHLLLQETIHHHNTDCEPTTLGFETHKVLRENLANYDYFCYLEDDIIITDPWFFRKIIWFNDQHGWSHVLLPNRYEIDDKRCPSKLYVDGNLGEYWFNLNPSLRRLRSLETLESEFLGSAIKFCGAQNPLGGFFCLSRMQLEKWMEQEHFLDMDSRLIGPIESGCSLGLIKTFQVYKPSFENANFLEAWHYDNRYLGKIAITYPEE